MLAGGRPPASGRMILSRFCRLTLNKMEYIFHEKQEGSLCAQHCLNTLLQESYFTAVDLADIGHQLDESERQQMAVAGMQSVDYQKFLEQPSSNYDDSGFFSIQVLQQALRIWNIELVQFTSSDSRAVQARSEPTSQRAYICNFKEHWFTIRKLGNQWFNLNSLLTGPELISNTYLAMFLTQLQQEGYSIFVVCGDLQPCEADQMLKIMPAIQPVKPRLLTDTANKGEAGEGTSGQFGEEEFERALRESQRLADEEEQMKQALALSMEGVKSDASKSNEPLASTSDPPAPSAEEIRLRRQAFLERLQAPPEEEDLLSGDDVDGTLTQSSDSCTPEDKTKAPSDMSEDEMLQAAIQMSMDSQNT